MPKYVRTCKHCGEDNTDGAVKCNGCGHKMITGIMSNTEHFHRRWACPKCSKYIMATNNECPCGYKEESYGWVWFIAIVIGLIVLANQ